VFGSSPATSRNESGRESGGAPNVEIVPSYTHTLNESGTPLAIPYAAILAKDSRSVRYSRSGRPAVCGTYDNTNAVLNAFLARGRR
jgi:hypothetical protein